MEGTNVRSSGLIRHSQERATLMVSRWLTPLPLTRLHGRAIGGRRVGAVGSQEKQPRRRGRNRADGTLVHADDHLIR